jgi:RNA polymerase sigma-70 factor, ECF subfamily
VEEALRILPHTEREATLLFYMHGWTIQEISTLTRSPVGTVKSRLFTARHHLRRFFDSDGEDGDKQ